MRFADAVRQGFGAGSFILAATLLILSAGCWAPLAAGTNGFLPQSNSALCIMVASAWAVLAPRPGRWRRWLKTAGAVFLIGLAAGSFAEHALQRPLGIDGLMMRPCFAGDLWPAGPMSFGSTLSAFIIAIIVLGWEWIPHPKIRFVLCGVLATGVALVSLLALARAVTDVDLGNNAWGLFNSMSVGAALLYLCLAVSIIGLLWQARSGVWLEDLWAPFAVLAIGLAVTLIIVQGILAAQKQAAAAELSREAQEFTRVVQLESGRDLRAMGRLQTRWHGLARRADWVRDAVPFFRDNPAFAGAALLSPDLEERTDLLPQGRALWLPVLAARQSDLRSAPAADAPLIFSDDRGGHRLLYFFFPLFDNGVFGGYFAAAYDPQGMLGNIAHIGFSGDMHLWVADQRGILARYPPGAVDDRSGRSAGTVLFGPETWKVWITEDKRDGAHGVVLLVLLTGGVMSCGLSLVLWQQARLRASEKALRQAAERLRSREGDLLRLNKELEQFAYIASHDLKAPLRGIDNLAQWMVEDLPSDAPRGVREKGDLLRGRVVRLEKILDDILAYSRVGRIVEKAADIDVGALIQDIAADVPRQHHIHATMQLPIVHSPRTPLHQVFQNFFANAIKHHDGTAATIEVSAIDRGIFWEFLVIDDGPGIPDEFKAKVYDMFRTLRPRDQVEGSGLGLSIIKKLVEWQRGRTWLTDRSDGKRGVEAHFLWPKWSDGG